MALVVEDGTGLATAESYLSVADADTYHTAYGAPAAWSGATTAAKETALRQATQYMDAVYSQRWIGTKGSSTQALDWPRKNATDHDGYTFDTDELPADLTDATAVLALEAISNTLLPDITNPGEIKSVSLGKGAVAVEWATGQGQVKAYRLASALLGDLVVPANQAVRA